jgi:hypothetical protein
LVVGATTAWRCWQTASARRERERELAQRLHRQKEVAEDMLTTKELIGETWLTRMTARLTVMDGS